jgi:hypothetical protein
VAAGAGTERGSFITAAGLGEHANGNTTSAAAKLCQATFRDRTKAFMGRRIYCGSAESIQETRFWAKARTRLRTSRGSH